MKPIEMTIKQSVVAMAAFIVLLLSVLPAHAGGNKLPDTVPVLNGSSPEGFAIGKKGIAYNGSPDGSL